MFNVPQTKVNEFAKRFNGAPAEDIIGHRQLVTTSDIFFHNIRLLNGRHTILTRDDFVEYYELITSDIELVSHPIDTIVPCENDKVPEGQKQKLFTFNQTVPEYERIKNRVTLESIHRDLPATHHVVVALDKNEVTLENVVDDVFLYWLVFRYIKQIELTRLKMFSNFSPVVEYVVENIDLATLRRYLITDKVNDEKVEKHEDMLFFAPDYMQTCKFYMDAENADKNIPLFDLDNLVDRLLSNICLKSDIYIILAIYLAASYAMSDFDRKIDSPCVNFVRNVLSYI